MADTASQPTTEVRWPLPEVAQVVLGGEHDLASAEVLANTLATALASSTHLIVDLNVADFIDSSTIKDLVMAKRSAQVDGKRFNLVLDAASPLEKVLVIAGVMPELNRVYTLDAALEAP